MGDNMFYNNHKICFEILNIFHIHRESADSVNCNRSWSGLGYRISGSTVFRSGNKKYVADSGSMSYIPAWVDYERSSTAEEMIILHLKVLGENENEIQIFSPDNPAIFSAYFVEMAKIWEEGATGYQHRCTSLFYKLLGEIESYSILNPTGQKEHLIRNSLIYMQMHFDDSCLSIEDIAQKSNISQVYFRKLYKEIFGVSPMHDIIKMRIQKAKSLLNTGYFSVSEIAGKCGFDNVKYFGTLFKKKTGKTPSEYMKK